MLVLMICCLLALTSAAPWSRQQEPTKLERQVKFLETLLNEMEDENLGIPEEIRSDMTSRQNEIDQEPWVTEIDLAEVVNRTLCLHDYNMCDAKFLNTDTDKMASALDSVLNYVMIALGADGYDRKCMVIAHVIEISDHVIIEHALDALLHDVKAVFLQVLIEYTDDKDFIVSLVEKVPDIVHELLGEVTKVLFGEELTMNTTVKGSIEEPESEVFDQFHGNSDSPTVADLAVKMAEFFHKVYDFLQGWKTENDTPLNCTKALVNIAYAFDQYSKATLPRSTYATVLTKYVDFTGRGDLLEQLVDKSMEINSTMGPFEQLALLHDQLLVELDQPAGSLESHKDAIEKLLMKELTVVKGNILTYSILDEISLVLPEGVMTSSPQNATLEDLEEAMTVMINKISASVPVYSPVTYTECTETKLVAISEGISLVMIMDLVNNEGYLANEVQKIVRNVTMDHLSDRSQEMMVEQVNTFLANMAKFFETVENDTMVHPAELMPLDLIATIWTQHDHGHSHEGTEQEVVKDLGGLLHRIVKASVYHWQRAGCGAEQNAFDKMRNDWNAFNESFVKMAVDPDLMNEMAKNVYSTCQLDRMAQPCPPLDQLGEDMVSVMWSVVRFLVNEDPSSDILKALNRNATEVEIMDVFLTSLGRGLGRVMYTTVQKQEPYSPDLGSGEEP